jgi:hypothetical protein
MQALLYYNTNYKVVNIRDYTTLNIAIFYCYNNIIKILTNMLILILLFTYNNLYNLAIVFLNLVLKLFSNCINSNSNS